MNNIDTQDAVIDGKIESMRLVGPDGGLDTSNVVTTLKEREEIDHAAMMRMFQQLSNVRRGNYHTARAARADARIAKRKAKRKSKR